jgi:hypothetical protein
MSCAVNLPCGSEARSARARARRSAAGILPGSNTVSRQTIASLFRLRRCASAQLRQAQAVVEAHLQEIQDAWVRHFGS